MCFMRINTRTCKKSLTEDKKQKMKDYQKQYRESMTDEQNQKSREYQK